MKSERKKVAAQSSSVQRMVRPMLGERVLRQSVDSIMGHTVTVTWDFPSLPSDHKTRAAYLKIRAELRDVKRSLPELERTA